MTKLEESFIQIKERERSWVVEMLDKNKREQGKVLFFLNIEKVFDKNIDIVKT